MNIGLELLTGIDFAILLCKIELLLKCFILDTEKMRTNKQPKIIIHHALAEVSIKPCVKVNEEQLTKLITHALDAVLAKNHITSEQVHHDTATRHGDYYNTPGYNLKLYRARADLTQTALAELIDIRQHHLSEMEHNKRPIGKNMAKKIAQILNINYKELV